MLYSVPWRLRPEHVRSEAAKAIRFRARLDAGLDVAEEDIARLRRVEQRLANVGGVLAYDPESARGWLIVPRRPGVDNGIVREETD